MRTLHITDTAFGNTAIVVRRIISVSIGGYGLTVIVRTGEGECYAAAHDTKEDAGEMFDLIVSMLNEEP